VLNGGHAKGAKEGDLVASADGVDLGLRTAVSARLATEVVLEDLLTLGGHVAASVLADVLPALADDLAVDLELVEGIVSTHSDGQRQHESSRLHLGRVIRDWSERDGRGLRMKSSINEEGQE
jgi:hypothetical protein